MRVSGARAKDHGASTIEYVALIVLAAGIVGALLSLSLPGKVETGAKTALCKVFSDGDCGKQPPSGNTCEAFCPTKDDPIHPSDPVTAATKGNYVAMGDSYASGEGSNSSGGNYVTSKNGSYLGDSGKDGCHRSPNAFSEDLKKSYTFQGGSTFVACSGATSDDVRNGSDGEKSQLNALNAHTSLVTLSVGGDDLEFSHVLTKCMMDLHFSVKQLWDHHQQDQCHAQKDRINQDVNTLFGSPPDPSKYQQLLIDIHNRAPNARIIVIGYPHLFPEPPTKGYDNINKGDEKFLNDMGRQLNAKIKQQVQALDDKYYGNGQQKMGSFEFADNWDGIKGHEIGTKDPYLNGLEYCPVVNWRHNPNCHSNLVGKPAAGTGTFHPTPDGQKAFEQVVANELKNGPGRTLYDP